MKKPLGIPEVEEILKAGDKQTPEPPENLLVLLKEEIPQELGTETSGHGSAGARRPLYLIAATLFLAVFGAVVTYRVRDSLPEPAMTSAVDTERPVEPQQMRQELEETPAQEQLAIGRAVGDEKDGSAPATAPSTPVGQAPISRPDEPVSAVKSQPVETPREVEKGTLEDSIPVQAKAPEMRQSSAASVLTTTTPAIEEEPVRRLEELKAVGYVDVESAAPAPTRAAPARGNETRRRPVHPSVVPPSTGGTAEPNDQPYGDMYFRGYGTNPFVDAEVDSLSTFGLDVDTGSYTVARSYIQRGDLPPQSAVRVEEFVNYFDYGDRPPRRGDFAITAEGARSPFTEGRGYHLLRFGLQGREIRSRDRKPTVLTFVVDVSGSMDRENRLDLVKRSLHLLLDELAEAGDRAPRLLDDRVGLVVYGSRGEVVLEPSTDLRAVRRAIDRLQPEGSTNAEEGLVLGYRMARKYFRQDSANRVILCSDGVANVGRTGPESILERIEREAEFGIELTTVGFGMGNYNDVLMEQLADRGDGRYAYVDTFSEARRLFVRDLSGTLETIASDAKLQVEFDPRVVSLYRLVGYENRDIADKSFRDDTVDAGEIGAGHQVTALYEVKLREEAEPSDRLATLRLRYRSERSGRVEEESVRLWVRDLEPSWGAASPSLRLAAVIAEFAEILKGSYWARGGDLWDLRDRARRLEHDFRGDPDVAELISLIGQAARLGDSWGPRDFED